MGDFRFAVGYKDAVPKNPFTLIENSRLPGMNAVYYTKHGGPEVLKFGKVIKPSVIGRLVLIRVIAASVNPCDAKLRENKVAKFILPLPKITGCDFCGEIVEKGSDCRNQFDIHDIVFGLYPITFSGWGTTCEYIAIHENLIAKAPSNITALESSSLPLVGLAVIQGLEGFVKACNYNTSGKRILIHAGAGGVGTFAIQYCKGVLGMEVYATCSGKNVDFLERLGADHVIDYTQDNKFENIHDLDAVLDPMAYIYEETMLRNSVLKSNGHYINIASSRNKLRGDDRDPFGLSIPEARLDRVLNNIARSWYRTAMNWMGFHMQYYWQVFVRPNSQQLADIARYVECGAITPVVRTTLPFSEEGLRAAHEKIEGGHTSGKMVILIAPPHISTPEETKECMDE